MPTLYDAFISYSHAKDKPVAAALQSVMQKLGKPWYKRRALRIFRDDTSLAATPELWPSIEQALGQSRYLIVLASPQFAASNSRKAAVSASALSGSMALRASGRSWITVQTGPSFSILTAMFKSPVC